VGPRAGLDAVAKNSIRCPCRSPSPQPSHYTHWATPALINHKHSEERSDIYIWNCKRWWEIRATLDCGPSLYYHTNPMYTSWKERCWQIRQGPSWAQFVVCKEERRKKKVTRRESYTEICNLWNVNHFRNYEFSFVFLCLAICHQFLWFQPRSQWVTKPLSSGVKRPEREADYLLPFTSRLRIHNWNDPPVKESYQMSNGSKKLKQEPRMARHCRSPMLRAERKRNK
jgi:hypothetical protein